MKNLRKQIGVFFNYKLIDKIHKNNTGSIDKLWNISGNKSIIKYNKIFKDL